MVLSEKHITSITPADFELLVTEHLKGLGASVREIEVLHNQFLKAHDGEYQIDVLVNFTLLNVVFKVLVECKRHTSPIKRDTVAILHNKMQSLGAQKGIIYATTLFQSGAEQYAREHGIALITVINGELTYHTRSYNAPMQTYEQLKNFVPDFPKYVGQFKHDNMYSMLTTGNLEELESYLGSS